MFRKNETMPSQKELFLRYLAPTSDSPMMYEVDRAKGTYLYNPDGEKAIDLIAGIGPAIFGHSHPEIVEAVKNQLDFHMHAMVYGEYVQSPQVKLAEKLTSMLPQNLNSVYLTNSGTEATEGAMKLVRKATGRTEIIALKNAYHGSSLGAASLMSNPLYTESYRPMVPGTRFMRPNIHQDLEKISEETAGVFIETIQGEAGILPLEDDYLQALRKRCDEKGTLLVADEIQCGLGRSGKLWAFEKAGIHPDVLMLAKGLGGGMPIGAFIASKELMQALAVNPILGHLTTFGGNPVSCAASLAVLDILDENKEGVLDHVNEMSSRFRKCLSHPTIREIRGRGLMLAVELPDFEFLSTVVDTAMEKGVLTDWFLFDSTSFRISPPLNISADEVDQACEVMLETIKEVGENNS